jgi:hypothetical protein
MMKIKNFENTRNYDMNFKVMFLNEASKLVIVKPQRSTLCSKKVKAKTAQNIRLFHYVQDTDAWLKLILHDTKVEK